MKHEPLPQGAALDRGVTHDEDDHALARRIVAGDRRAFERLMRRYNRRLYRLARATLRDGTEAEDALQDAYVAAFRSIAQFRGDAALGTWLSRLVLNECFARLRRSARRENVIPMVAVPSHMDIDTMIEHDAEGPEDAAERSEMRRLLERKIDELPETFRTVFVLRSVEEMSVEETAECLAIPEATVRTRHFRAKSLLRAALAQEIDLAERDVFEFAGVLCDRTVAAVLARVVDSEPG
jgi:RNA polymerase sigma factor (sigma-70 family)